MITTEPPDENVILQKQIVPRTQRVLYVLRISLCIVAGFLAFAKLNLIPPMSSFYVDVFSDRTLDLRPVVPALNNLVSGLLAAFLALIIATFLIQARVKASAQNRQHEGQDQP